MNQNSDPVEDSPLLSRRHFLTRMLAWGALPAVGGIYATQIEPFWLDQHEVTLKIKNLPKSFDGFRLAHLSDLHAGDTVPMEYLHQVVDRVNAARPDAVAVTGDILDESPEWIEPAVDMLRRVKSPIFISLGNHDYCSRDPRVKSSQAMGEHLTARLTDAGLPVLRNRAIAIQRGGDKLIFVGLDDLWSEHFKPQLAFESVATHGDGTIIALSHNPDTIHPLLPHAPSLILCGHTHGGQVRIPGIGATILPVKDRRFDQGLFTFDNTAAYVSRGVGFLHRIRFNCRPELPIFVLRCA